MLCPSCDPFYNEIHERPARYRPCYDDDYPIKNWKNSSRPAASTDTIDAIVAQAKRDIDAVAAKAKAAIDAAVTALRTSTHTCALCGSTWTVSP